MENQKSLTSLLSSFARAFACENNENCVFADYLAKKLMTSEEYNMIFNFLSEGISFFEPENNVGFASPKDAVKHIVNKHLAPTPLCRSAFCENALKTAAALGTEQYVILGAGLDTFALRESKLLKSITVFEADRKNTQDDKISRIKRANITVPENLKFVSMDFEKDNLENELLKAGFDKNKKTFFSFLGVSYYINKEAFENTLSSIAGLSLEGSSFCFDFADENLFKAKEQRVLNMINMAKASGEEMKLCFSECEITKILERHGFLIYELLTPGIIQKQIIKNAPFEAFEHINYALAVINGRKPFHI